MIAYAIKQHISGKIRIEIPGLRKMTPAGVKRLADMVARMWKIKGIRDFSASPFTGSVIIKCDPSVKDIKSFLGEVASDQEISNFIQEGESHGLQ